MAIYIKICENSYFLGTEFIFLEPTYYLTPWECYTDKVHAIYGLIAAFINKSYVLKHFTELNFGCWMSSLLPPTNKIRSTSYPASSNQI